jgi:hypothetical protein
VSYFRPQSARKIAPRSVRSLPNSTQKVSRKGGRVTQAKCAHHDCLISRVQSKNQADSNAVSEISAPQLSRSCTESVWKQVGENAQQGNYWTKMEPRSNGEATSIRDVRKSSRSRISPLGVYATHFIVSFLRFFAQSRR